MGSVSVPPLEDMIDKYSIKLLVYFGSYLTEFYRDDSDIDIAYISETSLSPVEKMALYEDLIRYHRKSEIDLVDLVRSDPILRYEVALNGKVLYESEPGLFEKYQLYYIKRYYEYRPYIEEEMREIGRKIREVLDDAE
jgi:predicted nucleotidyltransferase